ncbi:hypothetical protein Poli38472_014046 [Pythium oligandrum]|uniref:HECT E3 ubiquitin ligase n=1 Tax=Pythium oligandrum TaxID=41045 RepID=A0A8K1FMX5_PYTOL|nr:hypothetical protein Poli38472_014046 [Pythium oligandrum]|eukprot:TMW66734.1 hypothetical protein Poli38472_014046 [Pythium oligandrum]
MERVAATGSPTGHDTGHVTTSGGPPQATRQVALDDGDDDDEDAAMTIGATTVVREQQVEPMTPFAPTRVLRAQSGDTNSPRPMRPQARSQRNSNAGDAATVRAEMEWGPEDEGWVPKPARLHSGKTKSCAVCFAPLQFSSQQSWDEYLQSEEYLQRLQDNLLSDAFISSVICGEYTGGDLPTEYRMHKNRRMKCRQSVHDFGNMSSAGVSDGSFNEKSSVRILEEMLLNALPTPLLTAVLERRLAVISHSIGIAKRLITQDHIQKKPREFAAPTNNFEMHHLAIQTLAALLQSFNYENDHALPAFEEMTRLLAHSPALSLFSFWSPAKKCPEKILPLTRAMVDASSVATTPKLLAAEYAVDGSDGTFWQSQNRPSVTYFNIKCQGLGRVSSIRIQWHLKCVPRTVAIDFRLAGGDSFTFLSEQIGMIGPVQVFETRFPATCEEVRIVMSGVPSVNRSSCYAIEHIKLNTPISNTMFVDPQVTLGVISKWLIDALNHPNEDIVVEAIGALRAWTLATASLSGILYFVDMLLKVGKLFPYEAGRPGVARFAAEQAKLMMDALRTYRADEAEKLAKGKGKKAGNESRKIRALFEPSCCSAGVTVEDGGSAVRTRETSYQYAAVNVGITSGRASWRFRLDNDTVDDEMTCFGAAILPVTVSGYDSSPNLWMLRGYNGNLYARGHKLSRSIGKVHPGDIVQINVDMTEGTLSYKINDTDHGVVFTDIAGHEIYPAVSFYGSGKVITLLGVERWDDTENGNNSIEPVFLSNLRDYHHIVGYGTLGKGNQLGYASASSGASQAGSIQVEGESKQRCLSAHPPSRGDSSVMYDLSEGYDKLLGAVAINDDVQGDVLRQRPISLVFSILGDGKILWQSKPVSQIRAVEKFEVSVKGVRMLDMRVTCSGSNNCAHAIWVDPLLLPLEEWRCRECDTNNKGAMKHCAICGSKCYTDDGSRSSRQDVHIGVEPQEELCFDKVLGKAESPFGTLAATILEELAMIARIDSNVNQDSNQRIKQYLSEGMSSGSSRLRSFERPFSCQPCGEVIKQLIALLKACISEEDSSPSQHGLGVKAITVLELLKVNLLSIAQHDVTTDELGIDVVTRDELRETLEKLAEVHEGGSIKGNIAATVAADTIISGFSVMYTAHQKIQLTLSLLRRHSNESFHVSSPQCKLLSSVLHALAAPGKEGVLTFFQLLKDDDDLGFDFTEDVNEAISSLLALVCDPGSDSSPLDTDSIENDSVMNGAAKLLEAYQLLLFAEAVTLAPKCSSDREVSAKDQRVQIIRNSVQDAAVRFACLVLRSCNGLIERIVADHDDLMLSGSVTNGQHVFGAHRGNLSRVSRLLPWLVSCLCLLRRQSWLALPVLPVMTRFVGTMDRLCSVHQSVKMSESRLRCLELSVKARSMEVQEMERVLASDKALALHHQASKPMYNVFKQLYTGDKDHFDGQIGFQFEATSTFSIIALGRSVNPNKNGGKLVRQHTIRLWEEASQVLVAQVTVSAASRKDALGYAIEPLSVSVKLTQGKLYRLTTQEYAHGGDPWYKKENLPDEEYDPSYIKILRDCYASGSTGFPNSQNLSGAAYGVPTFLVEGADPLEEVPRFISPHGETLLKFSTKRSVPSLSESMAKVCMEEQFPSALTPGVSIYGSQDVVQIRPSGIEGSTLRVHWLLDMHNSTASVAGRFAGTLIAGHPVDSVEEELLPWLQSPLLSGGIHMAPVKRFRDECPDWQTALQLEDRLEKSRSSVRSTTSRPVKQLDRLMRGDGPRLVKRASFFDDMGLEEGVLLENLISDMSDTGPAAVIISWLEKVAPDRSFLSRLGNFPLCERLTCAALIKHSPDHILHEVQAIITGTKGGEDPVNLIPSDDFCLLWRRIIMLRHWLIKTRQEYRAKASDMAERAGDEDAVEPRSDKNEEYSYKSVLDMKISIPKDFDELMSDVCERAKFLVLLNPPSEDRERMATESQIALSNLADKWSAQKTPPSLEPMLERWRSLRQSDSTKWSGIVDVLRAQHRWRARRASIQVNNPMAQLPVSASEEVEEDASDRKYRYKDTFAAILKACDLYVRNGVGAPPEILSVLLERRQRRSEYRTFGLDAMKSILSLLTFDSARHNVVIFLRPAFRGFTEDERESRDSNDGQVVAETFRATAKLAWCQPGYLGRKVLQFGIYGASGYSSLGSSSKTEHVSCVETPALGEVDDFTFEVWVFPVELNGYRVIRADNGFESGSVYLEFIDRQLQVSVNGNYPREQLFKGVYFDTHQWTHVAVAYHSGSRTVKLLDVATRPGATRGLDEPNSVLQNLRFIGLRILEEEANTGKLHAADWLWTKQKESDQKPRREYSGASDSIAEEVYCGQALSSVRDLQLPAGSVDDDFDAELVQAIAMSMQESSRLPEQVIAQEEKEELENLFITHPRPLKIRQTSYTEAQEVASTYFHGDVSDHDGLLSSVLVKECVSHFVASTKVASEGTDRDCSADPSETLEFQSLHPYFARSEYTRAAVLESAHQCLRVSFDYRCKLGPNTKLTFFADSAYEKTISVFDGTSTADGRHIPDLIIHSNQFWFRFVATEDDVTKNYGYGYRFHVKPMQSISWSNESAVLEQPSLEWACWVLELILNEAKGLVARGAVHNRKIYGALVRYARSPGAPFKSRVVRILIQLLHEPDLFPLSEIPELETLEAIGNLALQRAKADRSGGRVFISAHLQQLVELSVITRRAALIFEKRLTGAANDMVIGASTISLPTPVTKAETSSVLDDFLAMSCFLLGTSDSLPGHILVSIWMEVFGSTGMIESAHPFSASTTTTGSVELNGAQTLLVTFDARCSTGEDSTLQIRCAQPSSQDEDSAPTSREFGGHEAWPSGTVAFSGDCLEYTFAAGENSDARFGVSACVFAIGLSIEQQLSRVTVGDLDKLMWRLKTQRSSSGSGLHWSPTMDGQLVDWINNHVESSSGNASSSSSIDLKPMDIRIHPTQDGLRCSQLLDVSLVDLHVRFALLKHFNQLLKESLPFLDLRDSISVSTIAHRIRQLGHCIFFDIKNTLVEAAIEATHVPGDTTSSSSNSARITLDRLQALESRDDREVEPSVSECFFAQAFRQLNQVDSSQFRRKIDNKGRLFSVKFRGEEGVDWGGVYREGVNSMVDDLFSAHFNLFVLCPNGQHDTGTNRGMYLPNPKCTSPVAIQMYEFVGKLLGISLRTHGDFPFAFPSLVWKQLIGQSLDRADLEGTDAMFVQMLDGIQNCERDGIMTEDEFETAFEGLDLRFTAFDCNGQEIELVEGGKSTRVTFENRLEYCQLAEQYRLQEGAKQVAAMARGLATIFPVRVLTLLTWHEMEMLTCGSPKIDINLWKQHTRYDGYNENDDTIKIFWEAMASFTDEQRSDFVRFAWGRSRLPRGKWPQPFKLTKKGGRDSTLSLPVAHTCFFSVELPPYTTLEKMRAMLLATINFGLGGILMA